MNWLKRVSLTIMKETFVMFSELKPILLHRNAHFREGQELHYQGKSQKIVTRENVLETIR